MSTNADLSCYVGRQCGGENRLTRLLVKIMY